MSENLLTGKYFKGSWAVVTGVLGLVAYILAFFVIKEASQPVLKEILLKVGDVLVIGVILGYLTTLTQYLGIFKKELEGIVYCDDFISKRNDIYPIWEKVSKQLFKSKFKHINGSLLKMIKETYLPVDQISYYNEYSINIDLKWANKEKKLVVVTNTISFELIAEEKKEFPFLLKSWVNVSGLHKDDYYVKVKNYQVNNKPADIVEIIDETKDGQHIFSQTVSLKNEFKYDISHIIEKKYSLEKDFVIAFKAQYIIHKMIVRFTFPEDDFAVDFYTRGAVTDFKTTDSKPGFIEMKYKGILLPMQGYIIALKENT